MERQPIHIYKTNQLSGGHDVGIEVWVPIPSSTRLASRYLHSMPIYDSSKKTNLLVKDNSEWRQCPRLNFSPQGLFPTMVEPPPEAEAGPRRPCTRAYAAADLALIQMALDMEHVNRVVVTWMGRNMQMSMSMVPLEDFDQVCYA